MVKEIDKGEENDRTQEAKRTVLINGIELQVSQQAQDLLAAFQLGAQVVINALIGNQTKVEATQQQFTIQLPEESYGGVDLQDLAGMDPLQREALLSAYNLRVNEPVAPEVDRTAETFENILGEAGIATKPGPGGVVAEPRNDPANFDPEYS